MGIKMSNPGVLTLAEKRLTNGKKIRIEDNLGESIHIHYASARIDMTIKELIYLADVCEKSLEDLIPVEGFDLSDYDDQFLEKYSKYLIDLERVEHTRIEKSRLCVQKRNWLHLPVVRKIKISSLKEAGTATTSEAIVLFNDSPIIMSGVDKVDAGDENSEVNVIRLHFRNQKYTCSPRPWLAFLFKWNKARLRSVAYAIEKFI